MIGKAIVDNSAKPTYVEQKFCFVLATNASKKDLKDESLLYHYKAQSHVERGFRFLKDTLFFVSSLFIKKPSRIDVLLMVMTLSLLVYTITQRRLRANMAKAKLTLLNQINKQIATPTMRWVFRCFKGINLVQSQEDYQYEQVHIDGINEVRMLVINQLAGTMSRYYKIKNSDGGV